MKPVTALPTCYFKWFVAGCLFIISFSVIISFNARTLNAFSHKKKINEFYIVGKKQYFLKILKTPLSMFIMLTKNKNLNFMTKNVVYRLIVCLLLAALSMVLKHYFTRDT